MAVGLPPRASWEGLFLLLPSLSGCSPGTLGAESRAPPRGTVRSAADTLPRSALPCLGESHTSHRDSLGCRTVTRSRRVSSPLIIPGGQLRLDLFDGTITVQSERGLWNPLSSPLSCVMVPSVPCHWHSALPLSSMPRSRVPCTRVNRAPDTGESVTQCGQPCPCI